MDADSNEISANKSEERCSSSPTPSNSLPSSSSSSASSSSASSSTCAVCSHQSHGLHFGVQACRACAAFFRRTVVLNKKYSCRRVAEQCEISKDVRYLCRYCRYQKCLRVGMTTDNVQWNRDRLSSSVRLDPKADANGKEGGRVGPAVPTESKLPEKGPNQEEGSTFGDTVIQYGGSPPVRQPKPSAPLSPSVAKLYVDLTRTAQQVEGIFTSYTPDMTSPFHLTGLQRMSIATERLRGVLNRNPTIRCAVDFSQMAAHWMDTLVSCARWMQHCEEFAALDLQEKTKVFKNTWCSFHRLEKVAVSIDIFGEDVLSKKLFMCDNDSAIASGTNFDSTDVSDCASEQIHRFFRPTTDKVFEEVARPMLALRLSLFEIVYIMCVTMWNVEGRDVSAATLRVAEAFKERISNELHDYYVHSMRIPNYADRMIKLLSIVHANEKIQHARSEMWEMIRLFDIFNFELPGLDFLDPKRM